MSTEQILSLESREIFEKGRKFATDLRKNRKQEFMLSKTKPKIIPQKLF
jgi:hypothetical protein